MKLTTKRVAQLAVTVAMLIIGAYVSIPLQPIPVTLQTVFVILTPLLFGGTAYIAVLSYLLLGLAGLPVFAGGTSGLAAFAGPTGGFLAGFLLTSIVIGFVADRWHPVCFLRDLLLAEGSLAILYIPGILWMQHVLVLRGAAQTALAALVPVLGLDILKMLMVAFLARPLREALRSS